MVLSINNALLSPKKLKFRTITEPIELDIRVLQATHNG